MHALFTLGWLGSSPSTAPSRSSRRTKGRTCVWRGGALIVGVWGGTNGCYDYQLIVRVIKPEYNHKTSQTRTRRQSVRFQTKLF